MHATQHIITAIVVALAIAYATYRIWLTVKRANDPCWGCEGCELKKQMQKARHNTSVAAKKQLKTCPRQEKLHENLAE